MHYLRMDESARHLRAVEEAYVTLQEDFHLRGRLPADRGFAAGT